MRRPADAWLALCLALAAALLGSRAALFAGILPEGVERAVAASLQLQVRSMGWQLRHVVVEIALVAAVSVVLAVRRRWLWEPREEGVRALRPWARAAIGTLVLYHSYLLDADPYVAALALPTWLALAAWALVASPARRAPALGAALAFVLLAGVWLAPTALCRAALLAWGLVLAAALRSGGRSLVSRDAALLALVVLPLFTFVVPIVLTPFFPGPLRQQAQLLESRGYAYDMCERPGGHQLFMAVPVCPGSKVRGVCLDAYVAEYDTRDFSRTGEHRFFDEEFSGRMRELLCLGDVVQLTMVSALLGDRLRSANVMEFDADDPSRFRRTIYSDDLLYRHGVDIPGHRVAWDRRRDAVYYLSEWTNKVFRLDRRSGELDETRGEVLPPKELRMHRNFGPLTTEEAVDERRDGLFVYEWGDGDRLWELDLATGALRRTLRFHDGGGVAAAVDEPRDRLVVSGLWGIHVFDLESGELIRRRRLGMGVRVARFDRRHGLVYFGTTFGGHLWVLDADDFGTVGRITTGTGGRRPYLTADGRDLLFSDQSRVWRLPTDAIARHFGRAP